MIDNNTKLYAHIKFPIKICHLRSRKRKERKKEKLTWSNLTSIETRSKRIKCNRKHWPLLKPRKTLFLFYWIVYSGGKRIIKSNSRCSVAPRLLTYFTAELFSRRDSVASGEKVGRLNGVGEWISRSRFQPYGIPEFTLSHLAQRDRLTRARS